MFRKSHYLFLKSKYKIGFFGITQKIDKKNFVVTKTHKSQAST
ncbi:hypothetical protein LEP1GSC062_1663 [Leptospira alexanderi serovar Manhao 3 str. L 60]|uniref:Uncharacterized protein n=1 Tax=Leptospira alexanderi serovar Manhao 3 str. L 60 TaxID=1049759 RepID=V6IAF6_9LEPT|nr:hypothetical protein LEP1GSC062_1663 [Leptospira alexanderi serovar Manhao 3 str. L 60]